jgi:hypothetical protein
LVDNHGKTATKWRNNLAVGVSPRWSELIGVAAPQGRHSLIAMPPLRGSPSLIAGCPWAYAHGYAMTPLRGSGNPVERFGVDGQKA